MKRWSAIAHVWAGQEIEAIKLLRERFPETKFRIGKSGEICTPECCYYNILALVPTPHPNEKTRIIFEEAERLSRSVPRDIVRGNP